VPYLSNGVVRMITAEERDAMESHDLHVPSVSLMTSSESSLDGEPFTNEQRYLGSYWMWVHPMFPVVHKLFFDLQTASPLLKTAILALGAHMLQNSNDMSNARIMHDRAQKVIKKRNISGWHTFRVCDMQALVLHEVFAIFRSRRPPLQFSKSFEDVYRYLLHDPDATNSNASSEVYADAMSGRTALNDLPLTDQIPGLDGKCKQRLLVACYVLDQQHAMLFGRQRTDCLGTSVNGLSGQTLPWIRSQQYWDAPTKSHAQLFAMKVAAGCLAYDQMFEAISDASALTENASWPQDAFRSMAMLGCVTDPTSDLRVCGFPMDDLSDPDALLFAFEQTPRMRLAYHTFMLCRHTPVRDLLAVAGESWVMAEKMSSQSQFVDAQIMVRDFVSAPIADVKRPESPVHFALSHALAVLDIHRKHARTGLMFQEWSIYLAAVLIWARAYVSSEQTRPLPRLSIPNPTETKLSPHELENSVAAVIAAGAGASLTWNEAKNVLSWTKSKIEQVDVPHNWGLTNGALDVLGKLLTRGNEQGWFA
jgi:hypothetical protein